MRRGRELLGLSVVVGEVGEPVGEVQDVIVEPDGRVKSIVVMPTKGLVRKARTVGISQVAQLGPDQVRLVSAAALSDAPEATVEGMHLFSPTKGLCGRSLLADDGEEIGTIGDVVFEPNPLRLWGFEVSDGLLKDLLDGRLVVEAAGATCDGEQVVLKTESTRHMNLYPSGHPTP